MNEIPALIDGQKHSHDNPSKQPELVFEISLLQTEDKSDKNTDSQPAADDLMIGEEEVDGRVPEAEDGELCQDQYTQGVVGDAEIYVPVDIFGEGDVYLFLFVALQGVYLGEHHEVQEQDEERRVHLACCQNGHKPQEHKYRGAGPFEEVFIKL